MVAATHTAERQLADLVYDRSEPLAELDNEEAFAASFDRFADARVVLLGEASHGTSEFYRARAAITRRLVEKHGFIIVAIEGDWPDVGELDRFVRAHGTWGERSAFVNFPRWMWRNREFRDLLVHLRRWNEHEVRGLDVYSLHRSVDEVLRYLDRVDAQAAAVARRRYACISPFLERPQVYARGDPSLRDALALRRLERAIGVIYRPETELMGHYFDAHLSRQFDALVWFEETNPVTPLPGAPAEGALDIYPFGI